MRREPSGSESGFRVAKGKIKNHTYENRFVGFRNSLLATRNWLLHLQWCSDSDWLSQTVEAAPNARARPLSYSHRHACSRNYSLLTINYSLLYLTSHKLNCGI